MSFLRHACSGGAPPSKSNCREHSRPRLHQPRRTQQKQHRREPKNPAPIGAGTHEVASPAAARSGRRNPPPATSAFGSGRCCRSPSPHAYLFPTKCYSLLVAVAGLQPIGGAIQKIRWMDALIPRGPRLLLSGTRLRADPNPRRPHASRLAAPRNRIGAPAYGRRARDRARHQTVQRPGAGRIGPIPTNRVSSLPACFNLRRPAAERLARWRCGLWSRSLAWSGVEKTRGRRRSSALESYPGFWRKRRTRRWLPPASIGTAPLGFGGCSNSQVGWFPFADGCLLILMSKSVEPR